MVSHWKFEHLEPYIFQLIAWDSHLGWLWHSQKILEDSKWLIWLILNQLRTCFANPPWQTGNWPSWLVSDCLQSKTEASHCGKVCVARNWDNRAIMAEGGLSKSSKCSSAGILGIGSSRRQQILPATILGEIQSRVVGKMQIDNLGFFTAAAAPYLYFCRIIDFQIFFYQIIKRSSKPIHDMRLSWWNHFILFSNFAPWLLIGYF